MPVPANGVVTGGGAEAVSYRDHCLTLLGVVVPLSLEAPSGSTLGRGGVHSSLNSTGFEKVVKATTDNFTL